MRRHFPTSVIAAVAPGSAYHTKANARTCSELNGCGRVAWSASSTVWTASASRAVRVMDCATGAIEKGTQGLLLLLMMIMMYE